MPESTPELLKRSTRLSEHKGIAVCDFASFLKQTKEDAVWSVRINEQHRAVGECHGKMTESALIGTHHNFDSHSS